MSNASAESSQKEGSQVPGQGGEAGEGSPVGVAPPCLPAVATGRPEARDQQKALETVMNQVNTPLQEEGAIAKIHVDSQSRLTSRAVR